MSHTVQIRGDRAVFPGDACVHCLRPATDKVELVRVKGSTVRKVSVPFCDECIATRQHRSWSEVQFGRIATLLSFLLAWLASVWAYATVLPGNTADALGVWVWGFLLAILVIEIVFGVLYLVVRPWSRRFRSLETKAVLAAVTIRDFDWETTTPDFASEEYAERFALVNQGPDTEEPVKGKET